MDQGVMERYCRAIRKRSSLRLFETQPMIRRIIHIVLLILFIAVPVSRTEAAQDVWTGVKRIVAVGDLHGDYDQFVAVLASAGLIDANEDWTGGKTHLVQTGDVVDRGADSRKIMDLLMKLEKQASRAGGYVHALIGNHESMNVYGDVRYVSPGEFSAFSNKNSQKFRRAIYEAHVEKAMKIPRTGSGPVFDDAYRSEWEARYPLGYFEHHDQLGPSGKYGKWIRRHNALIKINDTLYLHGGISPKYANDSIRRINDRVREELGNFSKLGGGVVMDMDGPLWYRELAQGSGKELRDHIKATLAHYGAHRIVIAHTVTPGAVLPRFGGRIVLIEVGIPKLYGGTVACLLMEGKRAYALHRGEKLELPSDSREGLLVYIKKAAALDPEPSPLASLIQQLEARLTPAAGQ